MIKRWLLVGVIVGALFVSAAGYWLLATSAGLRFTLQTVVNTVQLPLTYSNLQGTILSTIRADSAQYIDDAVTVSLDQFETRFSLALLLTGQVAFSDIKSSNVEVVLNDNQEAGQPDADLNANENIKSDEVSLPVVISLANAEFKTLHVKDNQDELFKVSGLQLGRGTIQDDFSFKDFGFSIEPGTFILSGNIGFTELAKVNLNVNWKTNAIEGVPATDGSLKAKGTYQKLVIDSQINLPDAIGVTGEINNVFSNLTWNARIQGETFPLNMIDASINTELRGFNITANGGLGDATLAGQSQIWDKELGEWSAAIDGHIDGSQIELRELKLQSLESSALISVKGASQENFTYEEMGPFHVTAAWEKIQWPLVGEPVVMSDAGRLEIKGALNSYQVHVLDAALSVENQNLSKLNVIANGTPTKLEIQEFTSNYLSGLWKGEGYLDWENDFQWNASLKTTGVDTSRQWPDWSARLNGKAAIEGIHRQDGWEVKGAVNKVAGEAAGVPVDHVSLEFELAENVYSIKKLKFVSRQNKLRGAALIKLLREDNPYINASWNIDSQNLGQLIPGAKGIIKSQGNLLGELMSPQLSTTIQAKGLSYRDYAASSVDGTVSIDPKSNSDLRIRLRLEGVEVGETKIRDAKLTGHGTTNDHELNFRATMDAERSISWSARGGYNKEAWKGKLISSLIHTAKFGSWNQREPSDLVVSASHLTVQYYCLTPGNADAYVCAKIDSEKFDSWNGALDIKNLPVVTFEPYFPPQIISVKGLVNGSAKFIFQQDDITDFNANLLSEKGSVEYGLPGGENQKLNYQQLQASIKHTDQGVSIVSKVDLRETGEVDIQATLKGKHTLSKLDASQLINGRVVVDLKNLTVLPLIYPDIQYIEGRKYSEYVISGTIGKPVIVGRSDITVKSLTVPRLGIELKDVKANAKTDKKNNIAVTGEASSGSGKIVFQGEMLNYLGANLLAKLNIEGKNFLVSKTPEIEMVISPKVTAIVNNDVMRFEGEIAIPRARIQVLQSANMVTPSTDVVIVDSDVPVDKSSKSLALDAELKIKLGNDVSIEGFGASGQLVGEVLVREQPGSVTTGSGEIRFREGKFNAYNRELTIETGRLTFANSPIDNPIVAIQAVRKIDRQGVKVKAGVNVSGQAQNPKVELFSEPAMDQSDILSYMVLGVPMNQATEKDGSTLASAASSIGLMGGELLANEIAKKLGIDIGDIKFTTDAATQQPLVGAYLNPRLYAEYVMGVGQAVNTFRIEYNLTNRWVLKTETSSEQQGADLFYTFEVD